MFELSQLRCFVAVAEELHFGRAALRLNMTQPPLSRQIQLLEHILDVSLFDRTSRSVKPTSAGRAFLPEARQLLRLAEGAALSAKRIARGEAGSVTIGFTAGSSYAFLPRLVSAAKTLMPEVDLLLKELRTSQQTEALASGRIDLGLLRLPIDRRGVEIACVMREPVMLAVPEGHPLASLDRPTLKDIERQPFIMYSPIEGRYFYDLVVRLLREAGVDPVYVQYISQIHSILPLVGAGIGISLVPESAMSLGVGGVVFRTIETGPAPLAELFCAWRRDNESPTLRAFRNLVLQDFIGGQA